MQRTRKSTLEEISQVLASTITQQLAHALTHGGRARLAIAGGTTPILSMRKLAESNLSWSNIDVSVTDERCVDGQHQRSNQRLVHNNLLTDKASNGNFIPLYSPSTSIEKNIILLESSLQPFRDQFDICVLGMGDDGHFASLFPDSPQLEQGLITTANAIAITSPSVPEQRISMSLDLIMQAKSVYLLICGEQKLQLIDSHQPSRRLPIDFLLNSVDVHIYEAIEK